MRKLIQIREDVEFFDQFGAIIETCKTVALSEYRSLEKKVGSFERLINIVESIFQLIEAGHVIHPFVITEGRPTVLIVVTSDAGLSGGLDNKVAAAAINQIESDKDLLVIVGSKGQTLARSWGYKFKSFPGVQDDTAFQQAMEVEQYVLNEVLEKRAGPVKVVYARPESLVKQYVDVVPLLPAKIEHDAASSVPRPGVDDIIMESKPEDIVEYLVFLWFGQRLFDIFGMARLAEVGARYMHAEDSSQKIKEFNEKLRHEFLRARHEAVDQQMRELCAARAG